MSSLLAFSRVYRLEIQSVMMVFSTAFVNYCPSNLHHKVRNAYLLYVKFISVWISYQIAGIERYFLNSAG
jgi:hypothetical protein